MKTCSVTPTSVPRSGLSWCLISSMCMNCKLCDCESWGCCQSSSLGSSGSFLASQAKRNPATWLSSQPFEQEAPMASLAFLSWARAISTPSPMQFHSALRQRLVAKGFKRCLSGGPGDAVCPEMSRDQYLLQKGLGLVNRGAWQVGLSIKS